MIFRNRSPKGIFGQNMSDLPNGPLTDGSRSLQSAVLKQVKISDRKEQRLGDKCNYYIS